MSAWQPSRPYNDLPQLPPRHEIETRAVLKCVVEARAALAGLDRALDTLVNPSVLINSIPLLEAQASSEIENIVTTQDDLFRFAQDDSAADPATQEALRYREALWRGFELVRARPAVTSNTAREICSALEGHHMDLRRGVGTFIGNPRTRVPTYTPPEGHAVIDQLMGNWESFMNGSPDLDPLVRMAIGHYQFEAIHPFHDGNGRTGRILNVLTLVQSGQLRQPVLYLSKAIIESKDDYYRLLREVSASEAWEEWVVYMVEAVRSTADWTLSRIGVVQELYARVREEMERVFGRVDAGFLDVLFEQPYCRIASVMERARVSRPTATSWLNSLVNEGALVDVKVGRDRIFINHRFMDALRR